MAPIKTFRHPALSLWQSAINEITVQHRATGPVVLGDDPPPMSSDEPLMLQSVAAAEALLAGRPAPQVLGVADCAQLYLQLILAQAYGDQQRVATLKNEIAFSTCDPLWAKTLVEYEKFWLKRGTIPYRRHQQFSDFMLSLPDRPQLRIALIGDWGIGTPTAQHLLAEVAAQQPDLLIHLGDIYYSGTQFEVQQNFLTICRTLLPTVPIYTLTGNHDMYSGGAGYYWLIDQLGQPASYFGLRNTYWQLLAMDTSLHDASPTDVLTNTTYLEDSEVAWHRDKIKHAHGRKTVLLSHHQLFSAAHSVGTNANNQQLAVNPKLYAAFADVINDIVLWAWGHEHNLALFDSYVGLARGRCIGSGAIPTLVSDHPYEANPNLTLPPGVAAPPIANECLRLGHDGEFYYHAYAILSLDGPSGQMTYYQIPGAHAGSQQLYTEVIG